MRFRVPLFAALAVVLLVTGACAQGQLEALRHDFPPVGKYQVLTGDFHMHTLHSDGRPTTRQRVEESYELGYDVISITDHGRTNAYRISRYVGGKLGMVVLRGLEAGVKGEEHMNVLGVSDSYSPRDPHRWAEKPGQETVYYRDEMKAVADAGGIVIYNHPHRGYREPVLWGIEQGYLSGIEVKNDVVKGSWDTTAWNGINCYPDAFDFAIKHNLTLFANTDAHGSRDDDPAKTLLFVEERSPEGVMEAFRARRTAAWFGGVVWGRQKLLADLVKATVAASKTSDGKLSLENKGPIPLKAKIEGSSAGVDLPAYQSATVDVPNVGSSANVVWENLWTDPRTQLSTRHAL